MPYCVAAVDQHCWFSERVVCMPCVRCMSHIAFLVVSGLDLIVHVVIYFLEHFFITCNNFILTL